MVMPVFCLQESIPIELTNHRVYNRQICQNKIRREREQVATVLEQTPRRRAVVGGNDGEPSPTATS